MNQQNQQRLFKCQYCSNEPAGIIYRPKKQFENVPACRLHATNLFIPFKNSSFDQTKTSLSKRIPPAKTCFKSEIYDNTTFKNNLEVFFDKLMENIILEFNSMKKQVMNNYYSMQELQNNQSALKFRMDGDQSYPYMIINNDEDMMVNHFIGKLLLKHNQNVEIKKRGQATKRRNQLSAIFMENNTIQKRSVLSKDETSLYLSGSPEKSGKKTSVGDQTRITVRKQLTDRNYCLTEKRRKN